MSGQGEEGWVDKERRGGWVDKERRGGRGGSINSELLSSIKMALLQKFQTITGRILIIAVARL